MEPFNLGLEILEVETRSVGIAGIKRHQKGTMVRDGCGQCLEEMIRMFLVPIRGHELAIQFDKRWDAPFIAPRVSTSNQRRLQKLKIVKEPLELAYHAAVNIIVTLISKRSDQIKISSNGPPAREANPDLPNLLKEKQFTSVISGTIHHRKEPGRHGAQVHFHHDRKVANMDRGNLPSSIPPSDQNATNGMDGRQSHEAQELGPDNLRDHKGIHMGQFGFHQIDNGGRMFLH